MHQLLTYIRIEAEADATFFRDADRFQDRLAAAVGKHRGDACQMQDVGSFEPFRFQVFRLQMAGRGIFSIIEDRGLTAVFTLFEHDARTMVRIYDRTFRIDAFRADHVQHVVTELIAADAAHPATVQTQFRQSDGGVGLRTGKTGAELVFITQRTIIIRRKDDHGFSKSDDFRHGFTPPFLRRSKAVRSLRI